MDMWLIERKFIHFSKMSLQDNWKYQHCFREAALSFQLSVNHDVSFIFLRITWCRQDYAFELTDLMQNLLFIWFKFRQTFLNLLKPRVIG